MEAVQVRHAGQRRIAAAEQLAVAHAAPKRADEATEVTCIADCFQRQARTDVCWVSHHVGVRLALVKAVKAVRKDFNIAPNYFRSRPRSAIGNRPMSATRCATVTRGVSSAVPDLAET
ncbi:hypothetical protein D3C71_1765080 [compost metagenome]